MNNKDTNKKLQKGITKVLSLSLPVKYTRAGTSC